MLLDVFVSGMFSHGNRRIPHQPGIRLDLRRESQRTARIVRPVVTIETLLVLVPLLAAAARLPICEEPEIGRHSSWERQWCIAGGVGSLWLRPVAEAQPVVARWQMTSGSSC